MSKQTPTGMPTGVRTPAPIRAAKLERFFERLAATCNVTLACREAGIDFSNLYKKRRKDPAFAERWAEAVEDGYLRIESELMQRAIGTQEAATSVESPSDVPASDGACSAPFDPVLALKVLTFKRQADPQGRRSGVRLKQPDPAAALAALERKLTAMEKSIEKRVEKRPGGKR